MPFLGDIQGTSHGPSVGYLGASLGNAALDDPSMEEPYQATQELEVYTAFMRSLCKLRSLFAYCPGRWTSDQDGREFQPQGKHLGQRCFQDCVCWR